MHNIQYSILTNLMTHHTRRFSELRPERVDSNLFQYHLKKLIEDGYVEKVEEGYSLSGRGLYYADRHSSTLKSERNQPKIIVVVVLRNDQGKVLLQRKPQQPWLDSYHLPAGKVHEGETILDAGRRELQEKTGINSVELSYKATVHTIIELSDTIVSEFYGVVLTGQYTGDVSGSQWYQNDKNLPLCPSVAEMLDIPDKPEKVLYEFNLTVS